MGDDMRRSIAAALTAAVLVLAYPASALEGWERLGSRIVDFRAHEDTVVIGRNEGRFSAIMLEANGDIALDNIRVTFGNGGVFTPRMNFVLEEGERSRAIDLPGETRIIRSVAFDYRPLRGGEDRATVTVYGR
jgi:hypothetical protein